jgi:hypothetical protein
MALRFGADLSIFVPTQKHQRKNIQHGLIVAVKA